MHAAWNGCASHQTHESPLESCAKPDQEMPNDMCMAVVQSGPCNSPLQPIKLQWCKLLTPLTATPYWTQHVPGSETDLQVHLLTITYRALAALSSSGCPKLTAYTCRDSSLLSTKLCNEGLMLLCFCDFTHPSAQPYSCTS